ncbi:hypothetical protein KVA01_10170 [Kocuria varians]|uniref:DUF559 domain-containing protein n=1 Tax=Kocuria varians TaxID=1272 RepID=A0A4Y4D3C1_KOCVA|nr:hypothetical protein [Kocuria varians]GEC98862.1 hypothetical protein KVA01_10170 [Kocuria varians]
MEMYLQQPVPFPPEPSVVTTAETGRRASQLLKAPGVQRLARGLWALQDAPLTPVQRGVLLQKHLCGPDAGLLLSGVRGLELLRLPVGGTEAWVQGVLSPAARSRGRGIAEPANQELTAAGERVDLLWSGDRAQSQQDGMRIAKSHGLAPLEGPWGSRIAHPLESMARLALTLPPWRITACLDALISTRFVVTGTWTPVVFTREQAEENLGMLPPAARGVIRLRRAWQDARAPCWSPAETLTRLIVVRAGLPEPMLNHRVTVAGRSYLLDLAWPGARIALEYNGAVHAQEVGQYRDEMHRLSLLRDAGWDVTVLTWDDLRSPVRREAWLARLRRALG